MAKDRPSDAEIRCQLLFSLSRKHGWGGWVAEDTLIRTLPRVNAVEPDKIFFWSYATVRWLSTIGIVDTKSTTTLLMTSPTSSETTVSIQTCVSKLRCHTSMGLT